jgi:hypothetical protein
MTTQEILAAKWEVEESSGWQHVRVVAKGYWILSCGDKVFAAHIVACHNERAALRERVRVLEEALAVLKKAISSLADLEASPVLWGELEIAAHQIDAALALAKETDK